MANMLICLHFANLDLRYSLALTMMYDTGEERAGCFTQFVFLVLMNLCCCCSVTLPDGVVDWSVVCDCGIS